MDNMKLDPTLGLRKLPPPPPETWGQRLARARETTGLTTRQVEDLLPEWVSKSNVSLLEKYETAPTSPKTRALAVMLLVLYGFDPTDFDLDGDDAPTAVDLRVIRNQGSTAEVGRSGERRHPPQVAGKKRRLAAVASSTDQTSDTPGSAYRCTARPLVAA